MTTTETALNATVQQLIDQQVRDGRHIGTQVAAYRNGELIVSAVSGQMGPEDTRPVQPDTLFLSFSVTKGVASCAVHILADRGLIDYDAPVAKYWPEFAANGKEHVTVAQALSHQAGLHAMPSPVRLEHLTDWQDGLARMANGTPAWEPGTATGYHAVTWGWIVGGIVQGATGRNISDVIREDIAIPLGIQDEMYVGIPGGLEDRLATLHIVPAGEGLPIPPDADFYKAMPRDIWQHFNGMPVRQAVLPSANGHFTARALAKMYAALFGEGVDGVRLVSRERVPLMQRLQTDAVDLVLGTPVPKSVGFFLGGDRAGVRYDIGPRRTAFGHSGAGGSIAFADPEVGLSVAVTINKMEYPGPGEGRALEVCDLIRAELGAA